MTSRTVSGRLDGDGLRLVATTDSGHTIVMDNLEGDAGPRPAELLVVAQAGCAAMDVVSVLRKKRQPFTSYEVRVAGDQRDDPPPHVFVRMRVLHVVEGDVDIEAVRRAIELSATKYCTVTGNLSSGVTEVRHATWSATPRARSTTAMSSSPARSRTRARSGRRSPADLSRLVRTDRFGPIRPALRPLRLWPLAPSQATMADRRAGTVSTGEG